MKLVIGIVHFEEVLGLSGLAHLIDERLQGLLALLSDIGGGQAQSVPQGPVGLQKCGECRFGIAQSRALPCPKHRILGSRAYELHANGAGGNC